VFAIWGLWQIADYWLLIPKWSWQTALVVAGVGAQVLLDGWHAWYLGIGLGGVVIFLGMVADLLLLATDRLKTSVLKGTRR
jgi:hypothetical protein